MCRATYKGYIISAADTLTDTLWWTRFGKHTVLTASHAAASNWPCHSHLPPRGRTAFKSKSLYHCCAAFSIQSYSQALTAERTDSARPQEAKYSFSNIARNSVWKAAQFSSEEHEAWRLMIWDLGFKLPFNTKFEMFMKNDSFYDQFFLFSSLFSMYFLLMSWNQNQLIWVWFKTETTCS